LPVCILRDDTIIREKRCQDIRIALEQRKEDGQDLVKTNDDENAACKPAEESFPSGKDEQAVPESEGTQSQGENETDNRAPRPNPVKSGQKEWGAALKRQGDERAEKQCCRDGAEGKGKNRSHQERMADIRPENPFRIETDGQSNRKRDPVEDKNTGDDEDWAEEPVEIPHQGGGRAGYGEGPECQGITEEDIDEDPAQGVAERGSEQALPVGEALHEEGKCGSVRRDRAKA